MSQFDFFFFLTDFEAVCPISRMWCNGKGEIIFIRSIPLNYRKYNKKNALDQQFESLETALHAAPTTKTSFIYTPAHAQA